MQDNYKTISEKSYGEYKEKGSKFLAYLYPFESDGQLDEVMAEIKSEHPKARHLCYAYEVGLSGDIYRINDDGEPSGTAGKPIYGQIKSNELSDVICVVVRYFGGTKLGATGLIRAYKQASIEAIQNATIITRFIYDYFELNVAYDHVGVVINELKSLDFELLDQHFTSEAILDIKIRQSASDTAIKQFMANMLGWDIADIQEDTVLDYCTIKKTS